MKRSKVSSKGKSPRPRGRRNTLALLGAVVVAGGALFVWGTGHIGGAGANATEIHVYKSPFCGCCSQWSEHLEASGFTITVTNLADMEPVKAAYDVPSKLRSCHTALVDGYVVEGHVPADVVQRLLAERPDAVGIAVPGMPSSAPGMDQPTGEPYAVMIFDSKGRAKAYDRR